MADKSLAAREARKEAMATKYAFGGIDHMRHPEEVWRAVEGDLAPLLTLLRCRGDKISLALADWLEGKLEPVPLPAHRPKAQSKIDRAWYRYDKAWEFIRRKGWHRKRPGRAPWKVELQLKAMARVEGVDEAPLRNRVRRAKPRMMTDAEVFERIRQIGSPENRRQAIAFG